MFICMQKNVCHSQLLLWDGFAKICKRVTLNTLRMLHIMVINDSITLQGTLVPKVLKSTCRSLSCLPACKKSTSFLTYFLKHCKDNIIKLLFWELWKSLTIPIKIIVSICSKYSCLPACRRSTLLRYCREIANFLFRVI